MAKPKTTQIKLVSSAGTGHFYIAKKNVQTMIGKLNLRKYDPRVRKHVLYKESKMK
ncbi:MAG: 50S ribosomal protein L33 [Pseudomonadota bacterium]|nr:50S ribosomal protein L33 [Pseudomonadota bacterium]